MVGRNVGRLWDEFRGLTEPSWCDVLASLGKIQSVLSKKVEEQVREQIFDLIRILIEPYAITRVTEAVVKKSKEQYNVE